MLFYENVYIQQIKIAFKINHRFQIGLLKPITSKSTKMTNIRQFPAGKQLI